MFQQGMFILKISGNTVTTSKDITTALATGRKSGAQYTIELRGATVASSIKGVGKGNRPTLYWLLAPFDSIF
jgi:hypothetical protein